MEVEDLYLKFIIPSLLIVLTAFFSFIFNIRSKKHEKDIEKKKELNIILADLLFIWNYFNTIKDIIYYETSQHEYLVAHGRIKRIFFHNNDIKNIFKEDPSKLLETSIEKLKYYDGLSFANLNSLKNAVKLDVDLMSIILDDEEIPKQGLDKIVSPRIPKIDELLKTTIQKIARQINYKTYLNVKCKFRKIHKSEEQERKKVLKKINNKTNLKKLKETIILAKKLGYKNMVIETAKNSNLSPNEILKKLEYFERHLPKDNTFN